MRDYHRSEKPDNTALWVVLGLVGGGLLLVVLACAGVFYIWTSVLRTGTEMVKGTQEQFWKQVDKAQQHALEEQQGQQVARAFLEDCLARRYNAAYEETTQLFRTRWPRKDFEALLEQRLGGPEAVPRFAVPAALPQAGLHRYRYTANTATGLVEFTVTLARENESWRVDEMSVDPIRR